MQVLYQTKFGKAICIDSLQFLKTLKDSSVDLVLTSPPFALQRKKEYGNKDQDEYVEWLMQFGVQIYRVLKDTGSFVLDLGGAYKKGRPVRSLYNYRALIRLCEECGFNLAEEFFWHNPSKLPSPIEWVNKRKIRVKDSVNTIWWLSKTDYPKANIRNVLIPYSERMKKLIEDPDGFYKPKKRPSGHEIAKGFGNSNDGAIPPNLLQISNSESNSKYLRLCNVFSAKRHPARFPLKIPLFFIEFLTDPGDLVIDIFAGSNTTGEAAEIKSRIWIACEIDYSYLASSIFRFFEEPITQYHRNIYDKIISSKDLPITIEKGQSELIFAGERFRQVQAYR
jgi:DNA modification methylase